MNLAQIFGICRAAKRPLEALANMVVRETFEESGLNVEIVGTVNAFSFHTEKK